MTASELERTPAPEGKGAASPASPQRSAPARPSLADKAAAPVVVKLPAPISVRLSQLLWVLSLAAGAVAVVYLFVIRQPQLPEIAGLIRGVDGTRADETYQTAADIIYWTVFGAMVAVLLCQITFLVSFSNRRPHARWWLLGTVLLQAVVLLVCRELVAVGDRGAPLVDILLIQLGSAGLALLFSTFRKALRWTARRVDVQHGVSAEGSSTGL